MKPHLPDCITSQISDDILKVIYSYVPHYKKKKSSPKSICSVSPNMERDLRKIQYSPMKGKNEMFMYDLDNFVL